MQEDFPKVIFSPVEDPDTSVVVLGWRLRDELLTCLSALSQSVGSMSFEVIVVLHGADEDVKAAVRERVAGVTVVETATNLGFGSGCNIGASKARGEFLVFLNDDTIPSADWLDRLTSAARRTARAGAISSRLHFPDGRLQEAGARLLAGPEGLQIGWGLDSVPDELLKPRPVDYGGAAALLVRRPLFMLLGGFDQRYDPAYFEDLDLCLRIRAAGWDVYYEPTAIVTHSQSASTRDRVEWRQFAYLRSQGIFRDRWRHVLSDAAQIDDPPERLVPSPGPDDVGTLDLQTQVGELADPSAKGRELAEEYANWLTSQLRSAQAAVTYLEQTLTVAQARGAALESSLRTEAALSHQEIERLEHVARSLGASLERLQTEMQARDEEIHRLASDAALHSGEIERLSAEAERLETSLRRVHQSRSWKVTGPLRALAKGSRRLKSVPRRLERGIVRQPLTTTGAVHSDVTRLLARAFRFLAPGRYQRMKMVDLISRSGLFDPTYYLARNPEVARSGIDPVAHYVRSGAADGLDPHPLFDTSFYRDANPEVVQAGLNPLAHYLQSGATEGRDPHPLFDTSFYRDANPEVVQAGLNPLVHYLQSGATEGRDPHPLFDTSFYRDANPEVVQAGLNPLVHYLQSGATEGRDPHPLFDTSFYRDANPEVVQAGLNPLVHYLQSGATEGRDPHPLFDTSFYRDANPEVVQAGLNPLVHYLQSGATEGRDPHPLFDTSFYVEQKPHVATLDVNPLVHFLREGPRATFDPYSSPSPLPETGVCIVTPDIVGPVKNGGIGTACYHLSRVLAGAGYDVSVLFTGNELSDCQKAHWRNVFARMCIRFIALSDTPPATRPVYGSTWFFERSWRVFEYLRRRRFSVIHFEDWHANGFWSIKAKRVGLAFAQTALTVMTHSCTKWINEGMRQFGSDPFETAKLVWAETYCIEQCDVLLSPSRYMLGWVAANQIRAPHRTLLMPHAFEDSQIGEAQPVGDVDNDHLIFSGRLETRKGLHILAEALRQLRRQGEALPRLVSFLGKHAWVTGRPSADYLSELQSELRPMELRIINDLDHAGALDYIKRTRGLVVIPSLLDNLPLTVIECIQNRIPFIAAMTGGIPEIVDPRVSFEPTPSALAILLTARNTIDHARMDHRYSASLARTRWRELHAELVSPNGQGEASAPPDPQPPESKRVSVCIPFFNHHRYLETLVTAFARQTYPDLEVVLVNDGSSPEASRAFDRVATRSRDPRFRFLTTENRGAGPARNLAAARATGEVLLFFDADNLPKGDDFVWVLARALQHSRADCVTCSFDIVETAEILPAETDVVATYRPYGPCLEAAFVENVLGDVTMLIARPVFERLGGFQAHPASAREDHEFLLNLCFKGHKLETVPDAIFYYRRSLTGRFLQSNEFLNYQSLFEQLHSAPIGDLARIVARVAGPMLLARQGNLAVAR